MAVGAAVEVPLGANLGISMSDLEPSKPELIPIVAEEIDATTFDIDKSLGSYLARCIPKVVNYFFIRAR